MSRSVRTRRLAQRLSDVGVRAVRPRVAIPEALEGDAGDVIHPTAEQLLVRLQGEQPSLSLSTEATLLESFLRVGPCRRVIGDGTRLRIGGASLSRDRVRCQGGGTLFDVDRSPYPLPPPSSSLPRGLAVIALRFESDLLCHDCRPRGSRVAAGRFDLVEARPMKSDSKRTTKED